MPSGRERLLTRTGPADPRPFVALVTRSDSTGVWCAPPGADERSPIGPCKAATRIALTTNSGADSHTHTLKVERLPVRTRVLLLLTDDGPWVLAHDREVTA